MLTRERVAWDSNAVLDLLKQTPVRYPVLRQAVERAEVRELEIVVCALCLCEVAVVKSDQPEDDQEQLIRDFFDQPWVIIRQVDSYVGAKARELIRHHGVKGPDAAHVAAAMLTPGVREFWTYDDKQLHKCRMLESEGLRVCEPRWKDDQPLLDLDG